MFQPPLYYVLSAVTLSLCGLSVDAPAAILVLRFLTLIFGLVQFTLVFLSLRFSFRDRIAPQLVGLMLAAFLPMQIYLSHFVTNETLAATLVTASVYLGLRLLRTENPSVSQFAWLGLCLGAAMLTKATALLLVPPLFLRTDRKACCSTHSRRNLAASFRHPIGRLSCYLRLALRSDLAPFWQSFARQLGCGGRISLVAGPRFSYRGRLRPVWSNRSSPRSSADFGALRTGFIPRSGGMDCVRGVTSLAYRPPWNYDLMTAGYLLALGTDLGHPRWRGRGFLAFRSQTVSRGVRLGRFYRSGDARTGFHDVEGCFLRAGESLLWISVARAYLLLRRGWLGGS